MKLAVPLGELSESPKQAAAVTQDEDRTGALGLQLSTATPELRRQYRIPKEVEGVVITRVADQSPAELAGLQPGDVLVSVDQTPVETPSKAAEQLKEASARGNVLLLVNRKGSSQFVGISVELRAPEPAIRAERRRSLLRTGRAGEARCPRLAAMPQGLGARPAHPA